MGPLGIDWARDNQNRPNDKPRRALALLAANDDLTNSLDVVYCIIENIVDIVDIEFVLQNINTVNGRQPSINILTRNWAQLAP